MNTVAKKSSPRSERAADNSQNDNQSAADISPADRDVLRHLAEQVAEIAALPVQKEKAELWRCLNDLESKRPLVWLTEIPWWEMNVDDELTNRCLHPWAQEQETSLRRTLYQWRHMPCDMIVNDYLPSPLAIHSTGIGPAEDVDIVQTAAESAIVSRHFKPLILEPEDISIINDPVVTHDKQASEEMFQRMNEVYQGILSIRKTGIQTRWFTPWDVLIRWWGIQDAMIDLVDRPEMVNAIVSRFVEASLCELDQWEALNLLSLGNANNRVGSGGYAYTNDLPAEGIPQEKVRAINCWGCSNAQIFSEVSPEMQWEFAIRHELPWLARWGLTYYGCCEPLDGKLEQLSRIPNLRKISMSPWIDLDRAVENVGDRYVFSRKPNPAIFAGDSWSPERARQELQVVLEKGKGCHIEFIMKDVSTVRNHPQRLWEWARLATELCESTR